MTLKIQILSNIINRGGSFLLFVIFFTIFALFTKTEPRSWNDASRMATIESLAERGSFIIDDSTFNWTGDKVFIRGHFYSGFSPVLPFLSSGVYFVLGKISGISFLTHPQLSYYLLTLFIIGGLTSLMLVFFYKSLIIIGIVMNHRVILCTVLAIGTLMFSYSTVFNNHTVSACLLFLSFYFILKSIFFQYLFKKYISFSGFLASLAATISQVSGGIFFIAFFGYIFWNKKLRPSWSYYVLGGIFPMMLYLTLNIPISGDFMPVNTHPEYYNYSGSFFDNTSFERTLSGSIYHNNLAAFLKYSLHCLVGKRGLFLYTPLLFFSLTGLFKIMKDRQGLLRKEAAIILLGCLFTIIYYLLFSVNYAGSCYGIRWFVEVIPVAFFFTAIFFKDNKSFFLKGLFYLSFVFSATVAIVGAYDPWLSSAGNFSFLDNLKDLSQDKNLFARFFPILYLLK